MPVQATAKQSPLKDNDHFCRGFSGVTDHGKHPISFQRAPGRQRPRTHSFFPLSPPPPPHFISEWRLKCACPSILPLLLQTTPTHFLLWQKISTALPNQAKRKIQSSTSSYWRKKRQGQRKITSQPVWKKDQSTEKRRGGLRPRQKVIKVFNDRQAEKLGEERGRPRKRVRCLPRKYTPTRGAHSQRGKVEPADWGGGEPRAASANVYFFLSYFSCTAPSSSWLLVSRVAMARLAEFVSEKSKREKPVIQINKERERERERERGRGRERALNCVFHVVRRCRVFFCTCWSQLLWKIHLRTVERHTFFPSALQINFRLWPRSLKLHTHTHTHTLKYFFSSSFLFSSLSFLTTIQRCSSARPQIDLSSKKISPHSPLFLCEVWISLTACLQTTE